MEIMLHLLVFIFGYFTCKTFYFLRSTKLSIKMLRASHLIYLSAIMKAIENLSYSREIMLEYQLRSGRNSTEISSFEMMFDSEVRALKDRSIRQLVAQHPEFFRSMIEFDDWDSSMEYLEKNKEAILNFWR